MRRCVDQREFRTKCLQFFGKMGAVNSGPKCLALVQLIRVHGAHFAVLTLGHVEEDNVRVKLRRGVAGFVVGP